MEFCMEIIKISGELFLRFEMHEPNPEYNNTYQGKDKKILENGISQGYYQKYSDYS